MLISDADRNFIMNKYHRQDEPFDPFHRWDYHGYGFDPSTGLDDPRMKAGLEELRESTVGEPHALIKAKGFAYILDNMRVDVSPNDYFVGLYNWGRLLNEPFVRKWREEALREEDKEFISLMHRSGAAEIWLDVDHFVPDWDQLLSLGVPGLLDRIKRVRDGKTGLSPAQSAFYEAMIVEYEALLRLLSRLADFCKKRESPKKDRVLAALENIRDGAPKTTLDALELMYIFFMVSEYVDQFQARSLGNGLDHTLRRFYYKDLADGTFTKDEIASFLAYFMLQFPAIGHPQGHPFYLGGMDELGRDTSDELTFLILDVYGELDLYNPKIQVKINPDTPDGLIDKVLKLIRAGKTSFMFACQPGMIKSLTQCYGTTYDEARDADISGCNEMHVKGDEASMTDLLPNAAKALLLALNDGFDSVTGTQLGPKTGDLALMESYGDFYSAFIAQLSFIIDSSLDLSDRLDRLVDQINPCVLLSALSPRALEEARDVYAYSAKYTNSAVLICSFATAVDSLMAVKKLVFDLKEVDAATLLDALAADWNGYEKLRLRAKRLEQKYGNGEEESDACAAKLAEWLYDHLSNRHNSRGGAVKLGVPSTSDYISQGKKLPATPDGRRAGEELSKNVAPVNGAEKNGVTGYIRSALKLVPARFSEAFVLDAMIHPSAIAGDDGIAAVRSLIKTYMALDGISIQFNVFSPEMLLDAQAHPEKYPDLQVRVTGWNALWNGMTKKEQDAYIERSFSIASSPGA